MSESKAKNKNKNKNKNKDTVRAKFICNKCGASWVYHEPICPICKIMGNPMNNRAERIIRKYLNQQSV